MSLSSIDPAQAAARKQIRAQAIAAREAMAPAHRHAATSALESQLFPLLKQLAPRVLGFCWPIRGEPDVRPLVGRWLAAEPSRRAALPVVQAAGEALVFHAWHPACDMTEGAHGIPVPAQGEQVCPELILIPLNAFDDAGYRLGYGGGYFDRTLAASATVAVGVGFEVGRVPSVFPQPHDCPMDWIVTEAGVWPGRRPV